MLKKHFMKESLQIRLIPPKPSPWGEGAPVRTLGRMRGRFRTQPFLVESLRGSRQSPQRNFSPAPLGKSIAPSSVTFGDSFPPRGSLWVVQPYPKKRPKSGHADGCRNSPSTGTMWHPTPKRASGNERVINRGSRGRSPRRSFLRLSPEKAGLPPGVGREPTSQVLTCAGPSPDHLPTPVEAPRPHPKGLWTPVQKAPSSGALPLLL